MLPHNLKILLCLSLLVISARGEGISSDQHDLIPSKSEFCQVFLAENDSYISFWNRRKLSQLEKIKVTTSDPLYGNTPWRGKNTLFFFAKKQSLPKKEILTRWKDALKPLDTFSDDARYIKKSKDIDECVDRMEKRSFDYYSFLNISKDVTRELGKLKPDLEALSVTQEINNLSRKVKGRWYIRRVFHMNDLKEELMQLDSKNIFIVAHARENGQILDSFGNALPETFFKNMSPTLFSLSLYNCYSSKTLKYYKIKKYMKEPNFYKFRYLFGVEEDSRFSQEQYAPLSRAAQFINKVDRKIRSNIGDAFWGYSEREKLCHLTLDDSTWNQLRKSDNGEIHITLSGDYLGTLRPSLTNKLEFPCTYIQSGNTLYARPSVALDQSIRDLSFIFSKGKIKDSKLFFREGKIISKKIDF
jgi:hypothetical protein